jgi:hypothetical protein
MIREQIAYRHSGGIEGFIGYGFTADGARRDGLRRIEEKLAALGEPFDARRLVEKADGLTAADLATVRKDWRTVRQALKDRGASIY